MKKEGKICGFGEVDSRYEIVLQLLGYEEKNKRIGRQI